MKTMIPKALSGAMALLILAMLAGLTHQAYAQDAKEEKKEVKVIVDESGKRVWVNGEEVDPEDLDEYMIRDGDEEVMIGPGERKIRRRVMRHGGDSEHKMMMWHGDDDAELMIDVDDNFFMFGPEMGMGMRHLMAMADPEIRKMEREARDLAREARKADGSERDARLRELDAKLDAIFERKLDKQREHLSKMREHIEEQQKTMSDRSANKDDIIDRRKRELLGEDDALRW